MVLNRTIVGIKPSKIVIINWKIYKLLIPNIIFITLINESHIRRYIEIRIVGIIISESIFFLKLYYNNNLI